MANDSEHDRFAKWRTFPAIAMRRCATRGNDRAQFVCLRPSYCRSCGQTAETDCVPCSLWSCSFRLVLDDMLLCGSSLGSHRSDNWDVDETMLSAVFRGSSPIVSSQLIHEWWPGKIKEEKWTPRIVFAKPKWPTAVEKPFTVCYSTEQGANVGELRQ